MTSKTIGQTVRSAYEVLYYFGEDLLALSKSLQQQMDQAFWTPFYPFKIKPWIIELDYYALYSPCAQREDSVRNAVMMQINLSSSKACDEPLILAVAARFSPAIPAADIWNAWHRRGGHRLMDILWERGGIMEIPPETLKPDFAPKAKQAAGFAIKVCTLSSVDELAKNLVDPLLECAGVCGYKPSSARR